MSEPGSAPEDLSAELTEVLHPYKQESSRRERLGAFLDEVIRAAGRDDFIHLDEALRSKTAEDVQTEPGLEKVKGAFEKLRAGASAKVERYRLEFIEDLKAQAAAAGLPLEIDFPRFRSLKGIEGEIRFADRQTAVNKKRLKSIDPRRIVKALVKVKRELYDRPFDAQAFVDGLHESYLTVLRDNDWAVGHSVPMQALYLEHVLSMQSKAFFTDLDKGRFRGYPLEHFAVDLWRYFQAGTGGTSKGAQMRLDPGRGTTSALWLIDSTGERRQIAGMSFQGGRK